MSSSGTSLRPIPGLDTNQPVKCRHRLSGFNHQNGYAKLLGDNPAVPVDRGMTRLEIGDLVSFAVPMDINLLFVADVIELAGGALILIGLRTHLVSLWALGTMTFAYAIAHLACFPTLNGGELAEMYWASFLILFTLGAGPFSADTWLEIRRQEKQHKKMEELSS